MNLSVSDPAPPAASPPEHSGRGSSEFQFSALVLVLGVVLILFGEREIGAGLVAVVAGAYPISRGLAKRGTP